MAKSKKLQIGDVFSLITPGNRQVFIQFIGVHPEIGECIAAFPGGKVEANSDTMKVLFYQVWRNRKLGNIEFVENLEPVTSVPTLIRRPKILQNRIVESWFVDSESGTYEVMPQHPDLIAATSGGVAGHDYFCDWIDGVECFSRGMFDSRNDANVPKCLSRLPT